MTNRAHRIIMILGLLAGIYLLWFFFVDGVYMNRPVTYIHDVNPLDLKLEYTTYHDGDGVRGYTAFCKNREASGTTEWVLSDTLITIFSTEPTKNIPVGCYPETGTTELFDIETIPRNTPPGCDYFFTAAVQRNIGYGRIITQDLRTEDFCVVA